ncbi:hypothetical protein QUF55_04340 [Clostridiaceae bacterium HSG29]|nr:hypothetical protein [Clostridiaceae bacterium HSG29]
MKFDVWQIWIIVYIIFAVVTLVPVVKAIFKKIKLNPGGKRFEECLHFTVEGRKRLDDHYSRIKGTLIFWKNKAEMYKYLHYYCLIWSTTIAVSIPVIAQFIVKENNSLLFLTIVSIHSAIIMTLHRTLKVEKNYQDFRIGESEFYDLYRRMLDNPFYFGDTEDNQIKNYIDQVEVMRKQMRNTEINNTPTLNS